MNKGRWKEAELSILEKMAGNKHLIDIVSAIDKYNQTKGTGIKRSRNAVTKKMKDLGLQWQCTEDYMSAYEWSRQLGLGKYRVSNWVNSGYLKPKKLSRNYSAISINQMRELATVKPHLFSAVSPDILIYFFEEELTQEILKHKDRCPDYFSRHRYIKRKDTGEIVKGIRNLARQLKVQPYVIRRELKKKDSWLMEVKR